MHNRANVQFKQLCISLFIVITATGASDSALMLTLCALQMLVLLLLSLKNDAIEL